MRLTARLGGLITAVVLGTLLVSPPSYAATKSVSVSCTAWDGLISYPSGTTTIAAVITVADVVVAETVRVSPRRGDTLPITNTTSNALVSVEATALSQTGKVLASGSATCS